MLNSSSSTSAILIKSESSVKWVISFLLIGFLTYKLITFSQYFEFKNYIQKVISTNYQFLIFVLLLLPVNWYLEAYKWKRICKNFENISIATAFKAVLAGASTGFITPNRTGEFIGRIFFLKPEHRKSGTTVGIMNSLTQNLIMLIFGIPAALFFFTTITGGIDGKIAKFILSLISLGVFFILLYFSLPSVSKKLKESNIAQKIGGFTDCLTLYSTQELLALIYISSIRYAVFCIQLFLMLSFFNIKLNFWEAIISIPANYLFVTFTPAFAFTEIAIRGSYAVFFIGAFSGETLGITLAGISIWIVNYMFAIIIGLPALFKAKYYSRKA